jgi:hypothetical protein
MNMNWNRLALVVIVLAALAALCAPAVEARGFRLSANISEPFEVNGILYPAGSLSVRQLGDYTPTSTFNEIWVGDECLGVVLASDIPTHVKERSDSLFFHRAPMGHLVLTGFAFRGQRAQDLSMIGSGASEAAIMLASR